MASHFNGLSTAYSDDLLSRQTTKTLSHLNVTDPLYWESTAAQRSSYAESVSISWRHYESARDLGILNLRVLMKQRSMWSTNFLYANG